MNCEKCQNEIFELIGNQTLSAEAQAHCAACADCQKLVDDLKSVTGEFGSDQLFYSDQVEIDKSVELVNQRIDEHEMSKVVDISARWKKYVPVAAAILLVIGIGLISQVVSIFDDRPQIADTNGIIDFVKLDDYETKQLGEMDFSEFVDEYSSEYGLSEGMQMIDDITEEEFKYLEEQINIMEIL